MLYVSATGATTAENLAYAARLGLWGGPEAPFMSRPDFLEAMDRGGVAAMELVARELKALAAMAGLDHRLVSPHVLRHTCAMHTLQATGDVRKVSLWLGHASMQSTEMYLRADPTEKLEALASRAPPGLQRGCFRAPDKLMAMLQAVSR